MIPQPCSFWLSLNQGRFLQNLWDKFKHPTTNPSKQIYTPKLNRMGSTTFSGLNSKTQPNKVKSSKNLRSREHQVTGYPILASLFYHQGHPLSGGLKENTRFHFVTLITTGNHQHNDPSDCGDVPVAGPFRPAFSNSRLMCSRLARPPGCPKTADGQTGQALLD